MKLKKLVPLLDTDKDIACKYYKHTFLLNPKANDYNFFLNREVKKISSLYETILIVLEDKK